MRDSYIQAKLIKPDAIRMVIFSVLPWERTEPVLEVDGEKSLVLKPSKISTLPQIALMDFTLPTPLELGHSYFLVLPQFGAIPLDVSEATEFESFDEKYAYCGDDLGMTYHKDHTDFAIWAPLASKVSLLYRRDESEQWKLKIMSRKEKGVYKATLQGDYDGYQYVYSVVNSEIERKVTDPYAKSSAANGRYSYVVDLKKTRVDFRRESLPVLSSPTEAVIYECHVRDMTISSYTDIEHKGKFLGLAEEGRKTKDGLPAGLDYLSSLGITHLQLLPIYDYKTVDELHPDKSYNWGYDPAQYFVPEGSYASDPNDPYSRIVELKKLVQALHSRGIRVVMDVVYNHVYEYQFSVFEKVVPNYFFRKRRNGKMASTSGCGNDLASERAMVRKMIVDCCQYWIEEYGIDGFRFDLMGILDVETMKQIEAMAKSHDRSFVIYGEGWNMGGEVNLPLAHMGNYALMPGIGFFNDHFRESCKRYLRGDVDAMQHFKNAFAGSCCDFIVPKRFLSAAQSINYVECHDNSTFFDFISAARPELGEQEKLELCNLATACVLFSFGVPFIHMGQEIGQSKYGEDNTYNKGDHYNKFSYSLLGKRKWMYDYAKKAIALRRKSRFMFVYDPRVIDSAVDITDIGFAIHVYFIDANLIAPRKGLEYFINPGQSEVKFTLNAPSITLFGKDGEPASKREKEAPAPSRSFVITSL